MSAIGFIGVGNMGGPMARNVIAKGHRVRVFDLDAAALDRAVKAGAEAAHSPVELARGVECVVTMLPAGKQVREVYLGASGLLQNTNPDIYFIDSSTIDIDSARVVGAAAAEAGFDMIDAPVSGGVAGAEAASLTFMVGGPDAAFARARPILEAMGKTIIHAGPSGSGQAAKICNNMILGVSMIAVSEAFVLAEKLGLDRAKLFEIASKSSGQCWSLTSYCPVPGLVPAAPANRGFAPGFTAAMMLKDLMLAQDAASGAGAAAALGAHAAELYEAFARSGQGAKDFSGIINMIREG